MRIGFNWETFNIAAATILTLFTELLFLNYMQTGHGYIVAYCYLLWALVAWYYLMHRSIKSMIRMFLENNE